ncbi:MAG: hypothetical protein K9W45_09885 [Candidatus Heimdallarchaeum aukensis]|uniref:Uncharacterized protein n=1 Tax=Candidatus Heimdallarchaeum aukensis TaxID=2876573 RepID=A0A9Y1BJD6_9ARCH|nr:MAG: hypothetical protein K9W45_09885 [Candidatus Heimdallarchaeum aukensis]
MPDLRGLMVNRLIVLIQIIAFPVYFYLWAFFGPMKDMTLAKFFFWRTSDVSPFSPQAEMVILKIIAPLIFALPFTLGSIVRATRIADSYTLMWRALGKVRIDTKLFYLVNAIFSLFFFILPFGSPILAIFGSFFAVKLIMYAFGWKKNIPAIFIVIPGLFLSAIPIMVTIAFYSEYSAVIVPIWQFWAKYSPIFYGIVLTLACAMAIGNFFILMQEGAAQVSRTEVNERVGILVKAFLFATFMLLYWLVSKWDASHLSMFIINIIAVVLSTLETLIRWRKGLRREDNTNGGALMVPIFIAANFFARYWNGAITIVVSISALLFFVLFILAYYYATDETLFE